MNISAASKAAGLPVKTVRYYADIGLVEAPSRSEAGYRTYDDVAVRKLMFVRRSRAFGFSIEGCRELLSLVSRSGPHQFGSETHRIETVGGDRREAAGATVLA